MTTPPPRHLLRASLRRAARTTRSGFTLIEVTVVCAILAIALVMLSGTVASTSQLLPANRETYLAIQQTSNIIEAMRNHEPGEIFVLYNDTTADDPTAPPVAPGMHFDVEGLEPLPDDADGRVGEIVFPAVNAQIREDFESEMLGTPRDLNGDTEIDDEDHSSDWILLPVLVRVQWMGANGPRFIETTTMFSRDV